MFPELPPIADVYPGYDLTAWVGLYAPAGTPEPVVSRLRSEVHKALADHGLAQKLTNTGPEPFILSAQEFTALIRRGAGLQARTHRDWR